MRRIILRAFLPIEHFVFHLTNCDMTFDVETRCVKENDDDDDDDDIFPSRVLPPPWGVLTKNWSCRATRAPFLVLLGAPRSLFDGASDAPRQEGGCVVCVPQFALRQIKDAATPQDLYGSARQKSQLDREKV